MATGTFENDTIAAIATSTGRSGIGIIRISGKRAFDIANEIFKSRDGKKYSASMNRKLRYGHIIDGQEEVDEVLVSFMKGPNSYTAEDVCEINSHGGLVSLKRILSLVLAKGARPAERGEFTRRAFLNGRIDLAQAEAVKDIIDAKSKIQHEQALSQLKGNLSKKLDILVDKMLDIISRIEYSINFMEDAEEDLSLGPIIEKGHALIEDMEEMIKGSESGRLIREGIATAIIGRPNVGKSSLLNAFLQEERAIVTDIPGTTRDAIEEMYSLDGLYLRLIDTAGLRETDDPVEQIGVGISKKHLDQADLVLVIFDGSLPLNKEDMDILDRASKGRAILLINKSDLSRNPDVDRTLKDIKDKKPNLPIISISARQEEGLDLLKDSIKKLFFSGQENVEFSDLSNIRHIDLMKKALHALKEGIDALEKGISLDACEVDIRESYRKLLEISGRDVDESVLDKIFKDFCVGK